MPAIDDRQLQQLKTTCLVNIYSEQKVRTLVESRARICRRLWTLRHRFHESIPNEKLILTWTWDMGTSIPYLFPNRFRESIFHPLTRLQIPAQTLTQLESLEFLRNNACIIPPSHISDSCTFISVGLPCLCYCYCCLHVY